MSVGSSVPGGRLRQISRWARTAAMLAGLTSLTGLVLSAAPAAAAPAQPASSAAQPHSSAVTPVGQGRDAPDGAAAPAAAAPKLTTNTPAPCNTAQPKGHAKCFAIVRTPSDHLYTPDAAGPPAGSLVPAQIQSAYNLPSGGAGQTVAVIDWGDDANAESDLAIFRSQFGLPPCTTANGCFEKVNEQGQQSNYPPDEGSGVEISLDLDAVSAACPDCNVMLVEASTNSFTDLGNSVDEAVTLGAKYISNSYGTSDAIGGEEEIPTETSLDPFYNHPGVVVTASAGDGGWGVGYPAADPDVVSVGGTELSADSSVPRGWDETAWGNGTQSIKGDGTGSGCSQFEPQPTWQASISQLTAVCPGNRAVADISADAAPVSGLAAYDTNPADGVGGWVQVGGTSLSSPLIAAMYALAGPPAADSIAASVPYQDPTLSSDLFDITSGSNGSCGNVLCNARTGWDGPTGLGTPDGVGALSSGPHGLISGTVTDASTGKAIAGATVSAGPRSAITDAAGNYTLFMPVGSYTVTVTAFGYATDTVDNVTVTQGTTTTENAALTAVPLVTVTGRVTDGSGQGWGLHAAITIDGAANGPVWTDPSTGAYVLQLPQNGTSTLTVSPDVAGYQTQTETVSTGTSPMTFNITVPVNLQTCEAPGYGFGSGLFQNFDNYPGAGGTIPPPGWTIQDNAGDGEVWQFNNPGGNGNRTGGSGFFAELDSFQFGDLALQDSSLVSPVFSLADNASPVLQFNNDYFGFPDQTGSVDVSIDGGQTWTTIWSHGSDSVRGPVLEQVPVPQAANQSTVRVRFHFTSSLFGNWWEIDNVQVGNPVCSALPGGLVTGQTTDANTGAGVNGVTVTDTGLTPAVTAVSAASADPAVGSGYFSLFSPQTGAQKLTAALPGSHYQPGSGSATVTAGASVQANLALNAGLLSVSPSSLSASPALGTPATTTMTITNSGTAPATVSLKERSAAPQLASATGAPLQRVAVNSADGKGDPGDRRGAGGGDHNASVSPAVAPSAVAPSAAVGPWSAIASYPLSVFDNSADFISGEEYSVGGMDPTGKVLGSGFAFNSAAGTWAPIASMPTARQKPGVVADFNNKLYVTGGWDASGTPIAETDVYDPASNTWSPLAANPAPTAAPGVADVSGVLYFVGGCIDGSCDPSSTVETYKIATGTWATAAPYPIADAWLTCGGIDGKVYCAGGDNSGNVISDAYVYDPASNAWSPIQNMPIGLWGSVGGAANGLLVISTGMASGFDITNEGFAYDPTANTWSPIPNAQNAVYRAGGSCGFYQVGGDIGFMGSGSSEQLAGLTQCASTDVPWLSESVPATIQPGQSIEVTVTMSPTLADQIFQPGTYTAQIGFDQDTPYAVSPVNVTMTTAATKSDGEISGTLSGKDCSNATAPLPGVITISGTPDVGLAAADGSFNFWAPRGSYTLIAAANPVGWLSATTEAQIKAGRTTTVNFTLAPVTC